MPPPGLLKELVTTIIPHNMALFPGGGGYWGVPLDFHDSYPKLKKTEGKRL